VGPERGGAKCGRSQQVYVDEANAASHQRVLFEKYERFGVTGDRCGGKMCQEFEQLRPILQIAARDLPNDEWMDANAACFQCVDEPPIAGAQVLNPDGSISEDHASVDRRLGTGRNAGSLPPRRASRRALSRSISARSPSCMTAVRSVKPARR
jgi:hypothetical protein